MMNHMRKNNRCVQQCISCISASEVTTWWHYTNLLLFLKLFLFIIFIFVFCFYLFIYYYYLFIIIIIIIIIVSVSLRNWCNSNHQRLLLWQRTEKSICGWMCVVPIPFTDSPLHKLRAHPVQLIDVRANLTQVL